MMPWPVAVHWRCCENNTDTRTRCTWHAVVMSIRESGCYYSNSCSICDIRTYGDLLWEMHFKRLHTGVSRVGSILVSDQAVFPVQTHGYQESSWTDALDSPQTVPWQNDVPSCHEIDSVHSVTATRIRWVTPTRSRHPRCAAPAVKRTYFWKGRWKDNSKLFYTATIIASHSDGGKFGSTVPEPTEWTG